MVALESLQDEFRWNPSPGRQGADRNIPQRICRVITVERLTKQFADLQTGGFTALDDVSFDVQPGEIFGLLGPNGAGKTTCLRILSTVLRPTCGTAFVAGYDVALHPADVRARIGFMSNNTGIYDRMTAWEMVEYFGRLYGIPEAALRDRIAHLFKRLQMNNIRDVLGSKMSTGMKQKVSIARTIIHDPEVVVFDEATSGLDVIAARAIIEFIRRCRADGKTVLFSTHIMSEVTMLADDLAIVHAGKLIYSGTLAEFTASAAERTLEDEFVRRIEIEESHA
jgi:sodium transport system ATP-binding protein